MSIFSNILAQRQGTNPQTLQGTMSNTSGPSQDQGLASYDEAIKAAYEKLNSILPPDINYQEKYQSLINDVQNQPVESHPLSTPGGVASSFAFAMGSPDKAQANLKDKINRHYAQSDQKEADLMRLKETLLQGAIQQEIQTGNFKAALKQSEALADIQRANADRERKITEADWSKKQAAKTDDAIKMIKERGKAQAKASGQDTKLVEKILTLRQQYVGDLLGQKDWMGNPLYQPLQAVQMAEEMYPFEEKKPYQPDTDLSNNPPKAAPAKQETAAQKFLREMREKGKK